MSTVKQDDRLGTVPTPRGSTEAGAGLGLAGKPRQGTLPTQLSAPAVENLDGAVSPSGPSAGSAQSPVAGPKTVARNRHALRAIAIGTTTAVLVGTALLSQADARFRASEQARAQTQTAAIDAIRASNRAWQARGATLTAEAAARTVAGAVATLAATPQAGDAPRAALQAAVDGLRAALAAPDSATDPTTLAGAIAGVDAPKQAAVTAQDEWQAAENARVAAEKAAAEQAAAQAAAEAQAAAARAATTRKTSTTTRTTTSSGGTAAPAAPAPTVSMTGVEYSAATVGAALNAFRASQGLPPMAIVRSAARVQHASEMAASNSIWHSSVRTMWEIVGRVSPVSATAMINAYANSPSHRAVMVGNFSTAYIGAVTYNGMLYTSIQCG